MGLDRTRIVNSLERYQKGSAAKNDELSFLLAICFAQLGDFVQARRLFVKSFNAMFFIRNV